MGDASSFNRIRIQILKAQAGRKLCQDMRFVGRLARFERDRKEACGKIQQTRGQVVGGSNPLAPTIFERGYGLCRSLFFVVGSVLGSVWGGILSYPY